MRGTAAAALSALDFSVSVHSICINHHTRDMIDNNTSLFATNKWYAKKDAMYGENKAQKIKNNILLSRDRIKWKEECIKCYNFCSISNLKRLGVYLEENNIHAYEILPPDEPLRLYFDLEIENLKADFKTLCSTFLKWVRDLIKNEFEIEVPVNSIVVLDSCREGKLSYHVMFSRGIYFGSWEA